MEGNYKKYLDIITGKAANDAQLNSHVTAMNEIILRCNPTEEETAALSVKLMQAAQNVTEVLREARVAEILALGDKSEKMWTEFIKSPRFSGRSIRHDKKSNSYAVKETVCRVSYEKLNEAYKEKETARQIEENGSAENVITIAVDNRFNTLANAFYSDVYRYAIEHNLGKNAAGVKAYTFSGKGNADVSVKVRSMNKLEEDAREMAGYLLPAEMLEKCKLMKADVRAIGLALVKANSEHFRYAGEGFGHIWFMNALKARMNGETYNVETDTATMEGREEQ